MLLSRRREGEGGGEFNINLVREAMGSCGPTSFRTRLRPISRQKLDENKKKQYKLNFWPHNMFRRLGPNIYCLPPKHIGHTQMLQGENSAILSTFSKLPFVMKIFVLSFFEWPLYKVLLYLKFTLRPRMRDQLIRKQ